MVEVRCPKGHKRVKKTGESTFSLGAASIKINGMAMQIAPTKSALAFYECNTCGVKFYVDHRIQP
jgi:hypothetical protein